MANFDFKDEATEPIVIRPKPKRELLIQLATLIFSAIAAVTAIEINNRLKRIDKGFSGYKFGTGGNTGQTTVPMQEELTGKV